MQESISLNLINFFSINTSPTYSYYPQSLCENFTLLKKLSQIYHSNFDMSDS